MCALYFYFMPHKNSIIYNLFSKNNLNENLKKKKKQYETPMIYGNDKSSLLCGWMNLIC